MRTLVVLRNVQFIITVVKGHPNSLQQPGYICKAGDLTSAIFNNPSAAVTTLYQRLFNNSTKFSGSLIMGHNKVEISEQLLKGVIFRLFGYFIGKFWLFVYRIGVSSDKQLYYADSGFKSSFMYSIGKEKQRVLFVQEINTKNSIVNMYQDFELWFTYVGNNPNNVWQKIDVLQKYRDIDIFGITLWNYHLRKFTLASIQWNEFFIKWYNEIKRVIELITSLKKIYLPDYIFNEREMRAWRAILNHAGCVNITPYTKEISPLEANKRGHDGKRRILSIIAKNFSYGVLMEKLKIAQGSIFEARKYARANSPGCIILEKPIRKVKRITPKQQRQFDSFFQDKVHVIMNSYKTNAKTGKPVIYLKNTKNIL
ncbi:hypothetical protein RhiirA4_450272 [Rhizophagus irregularis]|uniref:Uncharacterized protein n=1 Tax=Rhizophagus irregularis TaxID=588596 RepID=A0A2I1FSR6_9GLOM|nr:hypothetical protein RhiirA4_450272 [Rhizophagus irregularis]